MPRPFTLNSSLSKRSPRIICCSLILFIGLLLWGPQESFPSLHAHSAQVSAKLIGVAQGDNEPRQLELGKPLEHELAGGQSHVYQIALSKRQYLSLIVEQRGIDVVVALFGPDGKKLIEVDSPNGTEGPEPLMWIAESTGTYRLEIRSLEKEAKAGHYEFKIVDLRAATEADRALDEALSLFNEAESLRGNGKFAEAIPLAERAFTLREKALGSNHPDVAQSLNSLAVLYDLKGDYAKAEPLYQRALAIREQALGPNHPDVAYSLTSLAALYAAKGDAQQAITVTARAAEVSEFNLNQTLVSGSERQKLLFLALFERETNHILSLHAQSASHDPQALNLALTTLLRRKGRGLEAASDTIATLRRRANPEDQAIFDKLVSTRSQLATLTLRGPGKTDPVLFRSQLNQLMDDADNLEAQLSSRSAEFRVQTQPVTIEAIQAALPRDVTLVEFAIYHSYDAKTGKNGPPHYVAYVLAGCDFAVMYPIWGNLLAQASEHR